MSRAHRRQAASCLLIVAALLGGALSAPSAAASGPASSAGSARVENVRPPEVTGTPAYTAVVRADRGDWSDEEVAFTYAWLRDGDRIDGADRRRYRVRLGDIGHDLSVRVTATAEGEEPVTETSEAVEATKGTFVNEVRPRVRGVARFTRALVSGPGRWSRRPASVRYHWLRGGVAVPGAVGPRRTLGVADVGRRLRVRVTVRRPGFHRAVVTSKRTPRVLHRVPVRRVVTYKVETRGRINASVATFRAQAQQTFDDPRGWRGSGVAFRRVARGGAFTLVLAEARRVPDFSSVCSAQWSCRVGRFVIINQTRWNHASPMWNDIGRSRRDYRHMVVNHETGHWLGHGHRSCPGRGLAAPVMQQQSKGLDGCKANPWPTPGERWLPRFP